MPTPPLPRLLLFCDFLECRVHTMGVSLLRRMLADFFAGNEHTLLDFMRLGGSVVAVLPVERSSARRQQEAAQLLAQQKQTEAENVPKTHRIRWTLLNRHRWTLLHPSPVCSAIC